MLVLSRKEGERIRVGDSILVTIVRLAGDKVRLGIEAPVDVPILRDELEPHDERKRPKAPKPVSATPVSATPLTAASSAA